MAAEDIDWTIAKVPQWPEMQEFLAEARKEAASGTERGCVLIWSSMIEELCRKLLRTYLSNDKITDRLLKPDQALGTFSACVMLLSSLKAISENEYSSIDKVRSIRNDFAHKISPSFKNQPIKQKCENLCKSVPYLPDQSNVDYDVRAFCASCAYLLGYLLYRIQRRDPDLQDHFASEEEA